MKCLICNLRILFLLVLFSACNYYQKETPKVIDGFLDLKEWDIKKNGAIALDGNWEFYWNKLYTPQDFQKDSILPDRKFLEVPGVWNSISIDHKNLPGPGFATYRLRIRLNRTYEELSLKFLDAATSYQVWINNDSVAFNGKVSVAFEEMKPQLLPQVKIFKADTDRLEVVIQVANNFHHEGGLWESMVIGTMEQNMRVREKDIIFTMFLAGILFILFIYHLWIFLFRRTEKASLWFSILCLFILIRTLLVNERVIYQFFPRLNVNIGYRIEYITIFSLALFFGLYFYYLFENALSKTVLKVIAGITFIEIAIILFTKSQFYTSLVLVFQIIFILELLYFFIISIVQLATKKRGSVLLLISWLVALVFGINDVLYLHLVINTGVISHYAFFIFILTQAYILADKIVKAFNTIENLSEELNLVNINLEQKVEVRTHELAKEKKKSDDLLLNILPEETAAELKQTGHATARTYGMVTVLFTDIIDFTQISERVTPELLVAEIDYCFKAFDSIIEKYGIEKIKTVGDSYMCAAGLPVPSYNHAEVAIKSAIEIAAFIQQRKLEKEAKRELPFEVRIGIHSGPVVAGVVGAKKFSYDIWGDTVNLAARMEQNSEAGRINISGTTFELVKNYFICEYRGKIDAKNKGMLDMYFVGDEMKNQI